jgi:hypothetical protein
MSIGAKVTSWNDYWKNNGLVCLLEWCGRLRLVTKGNGLEIQDFYHGQTNKKCQTILLCKIVSNYCTWLFHFACISSTLQIKQNNENIGYNILEMLLISYSILIRFV